MPGRTAGFTTGLWISIAASMLATAGAERAAAQQSPPLYASSTAAGHSLSGTVTDDQGNTIDGAEIVLRSSDSATISVRAGKNGQFRIGGLPTGAATLRVRRLGYHERVVPVTIVANRSTTVMVKLDEAVAALDGMTVDGQGEELNTKLREFYARAQSSHLGYFIDEDKLDRMHPQQTSDALRAVPGVLVRPGRIGNIVTIRGCSPLVWVDGLRAPGGELDDLARGADVAAIEIYDSQAGVPAEYTDRTATCGTILVWLKTT